MRSALALLLALSAAPAAASDAEELLAAAIAYHDPQGLWSSGAWSLELVETRPGGVDRKTRCEIDNRRGRFVYASHREGALVEGSLGPETCELGIDGSPDFSDELREKHRHTCERLAWWRNYYLYLYGLPMKLRDPGTRLHPEVLETVFQGQPVRGLKVEYDPEVGGDTWYFYFDTDARLAGYRFYHDESKNDGEYIRLEGEIEAGGLRLPRARTWYTHAEDRLLGTDTLHGFESLNPANP